MPVLLLTIVFWKQQNINKYIVIVSDLLYFSSSWQTSEFSSSFDILMAQQSELEVYFACQGSTNFIITNRWEKLCIILDLL